MDRNVMALAVLLAATASVQADAIDEARAARDLSIASLERLEAVVDLPDDPVAFAEKLRLKVHLPLLSYYADVHRFANYDRSEVRLLMDCLVMMPLEVDRFSNEVEYALKLRRPLPAMVNRADYDAARAGCDAALLAVGKP